jgi:cytochrome bd ubiquinol oxidase subunit I
LSGRERHRHRAGVRWTASDGCSLGPDGVCDAAFDLRRDGEELQGEGGINGPADEIIDRAKNENPGPKGRRTMDLTALFLSRLQFAFTVSFHIIFPSFTIGLAAWLTVLEGLHLWTGRPAYRLVFEFWLKIFGVAFGLGVVSGIVMAFQFGSNWSVLARMSGPIQGPLLAYETFTAFALEASFFGILLFGRSRVPAWFYLLSTAMVALGTTLSAFWILVNNSWMQVPVGYVVENGRFVPEDWAEIILSPVLWVRFPHMLLASYLAGAFCVAATGAWYLLRRVFTVEGRIMVQMGLALAAVLLPLQLFFGHLNGEYIVHHQPSKMAAIEARWRSEKPASEVLLAWPDVGKRQNLFAITLPAPLGSLIDSDSLSAGEVGLDSIPPRNWPPVVIPFFSFRIMVGCGLIMLLVAWLGSYLNYKGRLEENRPLLWATFLSFPLPYIAILTGWFTAEVGRQPWTVYGVLRTADAMTPFLTARTALISLVVFCVVYTFIFIFGMFYIYRLLRTGPEGRLVLPPPTAVPNRPMSVASHIRARQISAGE